MFNGNQAAQFCIELGLLSNSMKKKVSLCLSGGLLKPLATVFDMYQASFINSIPRLLQHASVGELDSTTSFSLSCLDFLALHELRAVREALCNQVHSFFSNHVLQGLLGSNDEVVSDSYRELKMLGKLGDATALAKNSGTTQCLLETVAEVAEVAHQRRHLHFFSLVLLVERLDHREVILHVKSISLTHEITSTGFSVARGNVHQVILAFQEL